VFDHPVLARCQLHKIRNVRTTCPSGCAARSNGGCGRPTTPGPRWRPRPGSNSVGQRAGQHTGAAASLREGLDETLTVLRLGVPPTLARTLRSTNSIESMISICREHAKNV
jgi:hypothetical protein